ncbi:hypothetical protein Misp01_83570 [Microtetraspora sp. NBRC 13810]|uniref:hypothetical protein n=1 Tax=Microtetraspora sp. NBRC 13810 TaxID=3030990 RepID=UPI0024A05D9F|nr:hypothetical protein [Microtetraspora sp. NBRC 13810]GLW13229.1 hypothetical protein Misp01_83570 [Microtetraspora sp. NBRC 13810]
MRRSLGSGSTADQTRLRRDLARWVHDCREAGLDQGDMEALFATVLADSAQEEIA